MIRALVLDFDGTLVDTEAAVEAAWRDVHDHYGVEFDLARVVDAVGGHATHEPSSVAIAASLGDDSRTQEVEEAWLARHQELACVQPLRPGIGSWMAAADDLGIPMAIATSSSPGWVLPHLERLGLTQRFATICFGTDVARRKPAPDVYLLACERLGIPPGATLALEDSVPGAVAARDAGCHVRVSTNALTAQQVWPDGFVTLDPAQTGLGDVLATLTHPGAPGRPAHVSI